MSNIAIETWKLMIAESLRSQRSGFIMDKEKTEIFILERAKDFLHILNQMLT